jgi:hypothetical protein
MRTPTVLNTHAHSAHARKACGHARHVGTCPVCQRQQLARWRIQLTQAHQTPTRSH